MPYIVIHFLGRKLGREGRGKSGHDCMAGDHEEGPNAELVVPMYGPAVRRDMESGSTPDRIFRLRSH